MLTFVKWPVDMRGHKAQEIQPRRPLDEVGIVQVDEEEEANLSRCKVARWCHCCAIVENMSSIESHICRLFVTSMETANEVRNMVNITCVAMHVGTRTFASRKNDTPEVSPNVI